MKYLYIIFFLFLTFNKSLSLDTKATHAVILDYDTNEIIFDKNGSEKTGRKTGRKTWKNSRGFRKIVLQKSLDFFKPKIKVFIFYYRMLKNFRIT